MSDREYYVYEHWRRDTGVCFYVGKGYGKRAWVMRKRNRHHAAILSKLTALGMAVDVRIIKEGLSQEEAFAMERERIAVYGRASLANCTDGGDGLTNPTAETRAKIGAASKGRRPNLGKHIHNEESKKKLRVHGHKNIGVFRLYAGEGPKALAKKVCCLNDQTIYESASAAARHYGVAKSALIELCLNKNGRKTVGGLMFRYVLEAA